ncbi:hypothetical protein Moror_14134 [Moniliophthora roreri MCA 2997]|uniref:Uncharacterized protein n=1 Tax=Moniliophthora roreri (strain MCA 2997) TaxID=1381753 RepID=V2XPS5_MONRO|nr:hypothetical protein Moror_14134 [Moniliophthora roreri MCA 2997]
MSQPAMMRNAFTRQTTSAMLSSDMKSSCATTSDASLAALENLNNSNRQYPPDIIQERAALERIVQAFSTRISGE